MLRNLYYVLHKFLAITLVAILAIMVITVTLQILTRYVFFYSLSWSEELSRYLFVWLIFLGAIVGIKDGIQIKIDIINTLKGKKLGKHLKLFQLFLSIVMVTTLIFGSISLMDIGIMQKSPAMHIPMVYVYACMPIGLILMNMEFIIKIVKILKGQSDKQEGGSQ